jgi:hypothetical protein
MRAAVLLMWSTTSDADAGGLSMPGTAASCASDWPVVSHIAKVFEAGTTDTGRPFFAMELVKGIPITEYCSAEIDANSASLGEGEFTAVGAPKQVSTRLPIRKWSFCASSRSTPEEVR